MRILNACIALVILLGFSASQAAQGASPSIPLTLPDDVSWVNTVIGAKADGSRGYLRHGFIARGKRWRLETEMFNKPTVIIIFDGKSIGSNIDFQKSKIPEQKSPQFWDARTIIKMLYESTEKSHYKGIEKIDNHTCWHFLDEEEDVKINFWVDVNKMIPRRIFIENPDGSTSREIFDDLPAPIKVTPELFDPKNLKVMLTPN